MFTMIRIALIASILLFASTAVAQTVEPSAAQQDYNDKGVIAMQQGKFGEAVASFRSSLSLGELNVTQLNLGRAYFRMGLCLDAREAYAATKTAPKVSAPTPDEITALLDRFEKEYLEECSARLILQCEGNPKVTIGETIGRSCSDVGEWPVMAGPVTVKYRYGTENFEKKVKVEAGEAVEVTLTMDDGSEEDAVATGGDGGGTTGGAPGVSASADSGSSLSTYGWIAAGVGVALLGGAFAYDLAVTAPAIEELENLPNTEEGRIEAAEARSEIDGHQTLTLVLGGVGSAAIIGGIVMIILDSDEPAPVSAWANDEAAGFVWSGRW